jgi:serine/threonine protein kinase
MTLGTGEFSVFITKKVIQIIGTGYFRAPEIKNNTKYCYEIDIFSFGMVLSFIQANWPVIHLLVHSHLCLHFNSRIERQL